MEGYFANQAEDKPNFAGFEVIGVGLPGTGDILLKSALVKLLDGACYDIRK